MSLLPVGLPHNAAVGGERVDALLNSGLAWVAVLFVALAGAMVWAAVTHRRAPPAREAGGSRRALVRTAGVALAIFGLIDGTLFFRSSQDVHRLLFDFDAIDARPDVVRIEVEAHQWAWEVRYPGADGAFNTADDPLAIDELVVPVGQPVLIEVASPDVVHAFSLPNMRVKIDAVPGHVNALTFTASEPGDVEVACQQYCGLNHYKMRGVLHVVPPEQFTAWVARESDLASRGFDPADAAAHWGWPWSARK